MTDDALPDGPETAPPDEPDPDAFEWTEEPGDPDTAGMPGEYVNGPADGVPGVRSDDDAEPTSTKSRITD
jgi:hypothetical protein